MPSCPRKPRWHGTAHKATAVCAQVSRKTALLWSKVACSNLLWCGRRRSPGLWRPFAGRPSVVRRFRPLRSLSSRSGRLHRHGIGCNPPPGACRPERRPCWRGQTSAHKFQSHHGSQGSRFSRRWYVPPKVLIQLGRFWTVFYLLPSGPQFEVSHFSGNWDRLLIGRFNQVKSVTPP